MIANMLLYLLYVLYVCINILPIYSIYWRDCIDFKAIKLQTTSNGKSSNFKLLKRFQPFWSSFLKPTLSQQTFLTTGILSYNCTDKPIAVFKMELSFYDFIFSHAC